MVSFLSVVPDVSGDRYQSSTSDEPADDTAPEVLVDVAFLAEK